MRKNGDTTREKGNDRGRDRHKIRGKDIYDYFSHINSGLIFKIFHPTVFIVHRSELKKINNT